MPGPQPHDEHRAPREWAILDVELTAASDESDASFAPPHEDATDSGGSGMSTSGESEDGDSASDADDSDADDSDDGSDDEEGEQALPAKRRRTPVDYVALNEAMFGHVDVDNPEAFMQGACTVRVCVCVCALKPSVHVRVLRTRTRTHTHTPHPLTLDCRVG